jgi:hypothetical protein
MVDRGALDLLQAAHAFTERLSVGIRGWMAREERMAPEAALSLARVAISCANHLKTEIATEFSRVLGGRVADYDTIRAFNLRALVLDDLEHHIEQSAHRLLHPVLSPAVTSLLNEYRVGGQVLVTSTRKLVSYELRTWREDYFAKLADAEVLRTARLPFLIFVVPKPPLDWAVHYCLLFHEIGHAVYEVRKDVTLKEKLQVEAPIVVPSHEKDQFGYLKMFELKQKWKAVIDRWQEEIFADVFGLLSVGPAYFHSFCRVLGADTSLESCTSAHPPTSLRMAIMGEILQTRDLLDAIPPLIAPLLTEYIATSTANTQFKQHEDDQSEIVTGYTRELVSAIRASVAPIIESIETILGDSVFTKAEGFEDLERGRQIAELNIPAIEEASIPTLGGAGRPLSAARIFASNWTAYYLCQSFKDCDATRLMHQHGERLLNSLDAAEALRAWERSA